MPTYPAPDGARLAVPFARHGFRVFGLGAGSGVPYRTSITLGTIGGTALPGVAPIASPALTRLIAKLFARPQSRRDRRTARLGVERLEGRDVPAVSFTIEALADATEGGDAGQFRVTANGDATDFTNDVYAIWNVNGGTATYSTDFTTSPLTPGSYLTFANPGSTATLTITAVDDPDYEGNETVGLTVQRYQMYPVGSQYTGTLTIHDNDSAPPPPVVSVTRLNDAVEGGTVGKFQFARTGPTTDALTANYDVLLIGPGYAWPGTDYTALTESVTFWPGMATVTVDVTAFQDNVAEYPECVDVIVVDGSGYVASEMGAQVYIWDDYSLLPPEVTVSGVADAVEGGAVGVLRFARTGSTDAELVVTYTLATGETEATPGDDYTLLSGEITFPIGKAAVDITVTAVDDDEEEVTERVTATVQAPPGYEVGNPDTGVVQIADTDTFSGMIGGFVWDDTNEDGIQDATEPGRPDQPVTLLGSDGTPLFTLLTTANGNYGFGGLAEGPYQVQFSQPLLESFTLQDQGSDDAMDSDADPVTGVAAAITLTQAAPIHLLASAGLVVQRPAVQGGPRVVITDKDGKEVSTLKVAKWSKSFIRDPADGTMPEVMPTRKDGTDFIDVDDDRFNVRVYDPVLYNAVPEVPYVDVTIGTGHLLEYAYANDDPTTIRLVRMGGVWGTKFSGWYISDSQMLVSDLADDNYTGPGTSLVVHTDNLAPDPTNQRRNSKIGLTFEVTDRTHKALAGGVVSAIYSPGRVDELGNPIVSTAIATVPLKGTVNLHISNLRTVPGNAGPFATTYDDILNDLIFANEALAQVGIRVKTSGAVQDRNTPAGVDLSDKFSPLTTELGSLLGFVGPAENPYRTATDAGGKDDIEVYYINEFSNLNTRAMTVAGVPPNAAGTGISIIIRNVHEYTVLPHEILHVLYGTTGHIGGVAPNWIERTQLLVRGEDAITGAGVLDSRRIEERQEAEIFKPGKLPVIT